MTKGGKGKKPRASKKAVGAPTASLTTPDPDATTPDATTPDPDATTPAPEEQATGNRQQATGESAEPTPTPTPAAEPPATADDAEDTRPPRAGTVRARDAVVDGDGWPLDTSEASGAIAEGAPASEPPPAAPVAPPPPDVAQQVLPDPKAAALEAARIAEQLVGDMDSGGGAAIVAAAAAGAAIEAARIRARAVAEAGEVTITPVGEAPPPSETVSTDPVVTVRMQRDRILRALAEDVAAQAEAQAQAEQAREPGASGSMSAVTPGRQPSQVRSPSERDRRPSQIQPRPAGDSEPGTDEAQAEDELDPVAIAAAAIQRLSKRARTDLAELKGHYHRHDILVLLLALVIIVVAARVHTGMVTPPTTTFSERGLVFEHSAAWLSPEPITMPSSRLVQDLPGETTKNQPAHHVAFTSSLDPSARIEVLIDRKPSWSNVVTGLELERRTRWGELYTLDDSSVGSIAGHDWLRTAYRYAHVSEKGDVPRVDRAVEYATIDRDQLYVITLFGTPDQLERMEDVIPPTLRVPTQTGLPLVPQTRTLAQRTFPNAVSRAFDSTVMVVVADLVDGRLRPRGGGSGVVVGADGSILTNYHVIHRKDGKLHDVFVIGRFSDRDKAPQLWCAGRPSRSKLQKDEDLALIKCDMDLDGRRWNPASGSVWATLPEGRTEDVRMGQRLWVLGYPDVGGGGLTLSEGQVEGWTGEDGTQGKDFIRTDASITHGNSGGPVVDDQGRLVGVAAAFRTRTNTAGAIIETSQVGLVRPLGSASCLLAIATVGWTPVDGANDCDLQPSAVEAPAEGVRISTKVIDAASDAPVRDALVMILRPNVSAKAIDVNQLDDQVLAWGRSNAQGEVQLKQPVPIPGTYTVMVVATGYEPLIGENELRLDDKTPAYFDPWGKIWLRSR